MTRTEAVKKLQKLFGKRAYYRVLNRQTSPETRAAAAADRDRLKAEIEAIDAEVRYRLEVHGINALNRQRRELVKAKNEAGGWAQAYRFEIGTQDDGAGMFTIISDTASGDTWDEAFRNHQTKQRQKTEAAS